jgi:prephenate dehydratase
LRIELHLIALPNISLDQVKTVYSHPAALEQCRKFFRNHPNIEGVSTYDTAGSVRIIKEKKQSSLAAIASRWAAKDYGMAILCQEIEDFPENFTRFLIVSKRKYDFGPPTKTSIVFSIRDIPGALFKSLSVFFLRDINLVKIESRPLRRKPWEYLFYLDFKGAVAEKRCANALRHLEEIADFIKILGSYPSANKHSND